MRAGFTLLEMLILMALTALLVSILTPSLSSSRSSARNIECMNNLRQIGTMHFDPLSKLDSWGLSAYDLPSSGGSSPEQTGGHGSSGPPPIRRVEGDSRLGGAVNIQRLEQQAPEPPAYWKLTCPEAVRTEVNSYGMYYRVVGERFSVYSTSRDIIFGCSDFKIVDVAQNFAFRHLSKANFYFGDHHLDSRTPEMFTRTQWMENSFRGGGNGGGN
ncbi:MAG: prepilin-type N-terminal cleavage/methylation domain-containing protein [Phycisphaerales bacterium]|nr:prepilin-type N-terminal cleavage/methylation domain-containing protein [Phycisphaerales bacterium]